MIKNSKIYKDRAEVARKTGYSHLSIHLNDVDDMVKLLEILESINWNPLERPPIVTAEEKAALAEAFDNLEQLKEPEWPTAQDVGTLWNAAIITVAKRYGLAFEAQSQFFNVHHPEVIRQVVAVFADMVKHTARRIP